MAKTYFQPEVTVTEVAFQFNLMVGSAGGNALNVNVGNITDDQW